MKKLYLFIPLVILLVGCDELRYEETYKEYYAVESYLVANSDLPPIYLTRTFLPEENIKQASENPANIRIENASVEIRLLDDSMNVQKVFSYYHHENGGYIIDNAHTVLPKRWYQLHVTFSDGQVMTAKTFVPGSIQTIGEVPGKLEYQSGPNLQVTTSPGYYPGRKSYYVVLLESIGRDPKNLTPYYYDLVHEKGLLIYTFTKNTTGITFERNYAKDTSDNIIIDVPWSAFAFYGDNKVVINTIDDNLYDFWSSVQYHGNGMILSGGDLKNVDYNVNGGIGIFGSMSQTVNHVNLLRPSGK